MTDADSNSNKTLDQLVARLTADSDAAYEASPFSALSKDFFSRFVRDSQAQLQPGEIAISERWQIFIPCGAHALTRLMAGHLADFLSRRMGLTLVVKEQATGPRQQDRESGIFLVESTGGDPGVPESFSISVSEGKTEVAGRDVNGLRDGVVKLVDLIGFRQTPARPASPTRPSSGSEVRCKHVN